MTKPNQARDQADLKARERRFEVPHGHVLCDCVPMEIQVSASRLLTLTVAEVARHVSRHPTRCMPGRGSLRLGDLSGAVMLPSSFTKAMVFGRSEPRQNQLHAWQFPFIRFIEGDSIDILAVRSGPLLLWPTLRHAVLP